MLLLDFGQGEDDAEQCSFHDSPFVERVGYLLRLDYSILGYKGGYKDCKFDLN